MKSATIAVLFLATSASAFAPPVVNHKVSSTTTTTELSMGLFDAFSPKKKPAPKQEPSGGGGFLEGRGKKITIREDEDNAMWIDEDEATGERKAAWNPFGK